MAFSFVLNRLLRAQPWARGRLEPFAGETVEVRAGPLPALRLRIASGGTVEAADGEATLRMTIKPDFLTALARGEGVIVLVPEIALTPQTVGRFQARFGDTVALLHSALGEGERYDEWRRLRTGEARIAVIARRNRAGMVRFGPVRSARTNPAQAPPGRGGGDSRLR